MIAQQRAHTCGPPAAAPRATLYSYASVRRVRLLVPGSTAAPVGGGALAARGEIPRRLSSDMRANCETLV